MDQPLFPRSDLCQHIESQPPAKTIDCQVAELESWETERSEVSYYQIETQYLADIYSYFLDLDYNSTDPCGFVQQYLPESTYLDQITRYIQDHPLVRVLIMLYQWQGDNMFNSYLRQGLSSAIAYFKYNEENITECMSDEYYVPDYQGFKMTLDHYNLSTEDFKNDIKNLSVDRLLIKYELFVQQSAKDLQASILRAPPTTGTLVTIRTIKINPDYLNLEKGQITRLKGFTSTAVHISNEVEVPNKHKMTKLVFLIPPGSQVLPFTHRDSMGEEEILLPHGTQVVYERTLSIDHEFGAIYRRPSNEGKTPVIGCRKSYPISEIHIFRVINDPWEVQAALAYNPLNYNLYGSCLDQVSAQIGASVETLKSISEEHLFNQ